MDTKIENKKRRLSNWDYFISICIFFRVPAIIGGIIGGLIASLTLKTIN